ncbi:MAG: S8 family serine peptidase [Phycisphaerales bacterium]|nr:S8 family serine peptidase [Phycisphaerales bacterium]
MFSFQDWLNRSFARRGILKLLGLAGLAAIVRPALATAQPGPPVNDYPADVLMAEGTYELQRDALLIDWVGTEQITAQRLAQLGLQFVLDPLGQPVAAGPSLYVVTSVAGPQANMAAFTRDVLLLAADDVRAALPLYYLTGQGLQSAIAPVPGAILIMFVDEAFPPIQISTPTGLFYDEFGSQFLLPTHQFYLPAYQQNVRASETGLWGEPSETFDMAARIRADFPDAVTNAGPDWLTLFALEAMPVDEIFRTHRPWNLFRIGMPAAWEIQNGWGDPAAAASLIVAVLDNGFDVSHPDLKFTPNVDGVYTHFDGRSAVKDGLAPPYNAGWGPAEPTGLYAHGTLVAGIIGASPNNFGVVGVAGGCSILPTRIASSGPAAASKYAQAALRWARLKGAKVVNMSCHFGGTPGLHAEMQLAWQAGIILCAAAGNQGTHLPSGTALEDSPLPVKYPAWDERCIGVGASDEADQRKRQASTDQQQWASHWGAELDVVAPGVQVWTTDIQGHYGASPHTSVFGVDYPRSGAFPIGIGGTSPDYITLMMGTSAAAPHVAGLAALMLMKLSGNADFNALTPENRAVAIHTMIKHTCDKVNPDIYQYVGTAPNSRCDEMGFGRINALAALERAASYTTST